MDVIQQIGAYAGFAAVVGLAVLSALYFSQARDVKRLREWAGRAPERAAQVEADAQARAQAAARVTARPQARPAAAKQAGAQPSPGVAPAAGAAAAGPGAAGQAAAPAPGAAAATPAAGAAPATPAGGAGTAGTAGPGRSDPGTNGASGGGARPPAIPPRVPAAAQTSILPPSARASARVPWYRRRAWPDPRYLALIVAGVLVVGGGAAFGLTQLGGGSGTPAPGPGAAEGGGGGGAPSRRAAPVVPSSVTVSVLNGTTIGGLAADAADQVKAKGFQVGNVDNALDQAKAESVVLYAQGSKREAQAVAKVLGITQTEPADPDSQNRGGNASVIAVLGADRTP